MLWHKILRKARTYIQSLEPPEARPNSVDEAPWNHPFVTSANIQRFRDYSDQVWAFAFEQDRRDARPLDIGFGGNMAQSSYKFCRLVNEAGAAGMLYPHPFDETALSCPEWEDFNGEWSDIFDGAGFLRAHPELIPHVPLRRIAMDCEGTNEARDRFVQGDRAGLVRLMRSCLSLRMEAILHFDGIHPYTAWARALMAHDVTLIAASPIAAYLSGKPYCALSVGGDLIFDCGRGDDYGAVTTIAFNRAHFIFLANPHPLAHCRRLGLTNAVYLPYPMDDHRYCPGLGEARADWEGRRGPGVYLLSTARIDTSWKGNGTAILDQLAAVARLRPQARFVMLLWGNHAREFQDRIQSGGLERQFLCLPPVGKQRLIDYYRSCDVCLDQFVFGYYGATGLEAAACGKPLVMRLREEHYAPLYRNDTAPVEQIENRDQLVPKLVRLIDDAAYRRERGELMRAWLVRTHGRARTVPILLALLRLAAKRQALPVDLTNPLCDPETVEEKQYHQGCLEPAA